MSYLPPFPIYVPLSEGNPPKVNFFALKIKTIHGK